MNQTFWDENTKKYVAGQKEHGGNLWERPLGYLIKAAREEAIDQFNYLDAIEKQVARLERKVGELEAQCLNTLNENRRLKEENHRMRCNAAGPALVATFESGQ